MIGYSLPITALTLMDKIMKPASWFTTLIYKPLYILRAIGIAVPWIFSTRQSVVKPRILSFLTALRTSPPPFPTTNLKIGAAGFCWGGFWTIYLCNNFPSTRVVRHPDQSSSTALEPLIDCGFTAHPSSVSVPKDIDGVELPLSVAVGEEDMAMKGPLIQQMKDILEVKKKGDHEVIILPGAKHGFAVRSHPEDKAQLEHAETAEVQAIAWFKRWLS
jgi:dienelactone hydrolase